MKYQIEMSTRFKKDYKLAKKRGYNMNLLKEVIDILANEIRFRKNILIIRFQVIIEVQENVILNRIGYWFTELRKICLCWVWLEQELIAICFNKNRCRSFWVHRLIFLNEKENWKWRLQRLIPAVFRE